MVVLRGSGLDPRSVERIERRQPTLLYEFEAQNANAVDIAVPATVQDDGLKALADLTTAAQTSGERSPGWGAARKLLRLAGPVSARRWRALISRMRFETVVAEHRFMIPVQQRIGRDNQVVPGDIRETLPPVAPVKHHELQLWHEARGLAPPVADQARWQYQKAQEGDPPLTGAGAPAGQASALSCRAPCRRRAGRRSRCRRAPSASHSQCAGGDAAPPAARPEPAVQRHPRGRDVPRWPLWAAMHMAFKNMLRSSFSTNRFCYNRQP